MSVALNVLSKLSLEAFGLAMPRIFWDVQPPNFACNYTELAPLTLGGTLAAGGPAPWAALLAGAATKVNSQADIGLPLVRADGSPEAGPGLLITLFPQLHARLSRLYCVLLEGSNPNQTRGVPVRPVPRYFFYSGPDNNFAGRDYGNVNPGDDIGSFQFLRVYDDAGLPIDPLAMLYAFSVLMAYHPVLQWLPDNMAGYVQQHGLLAVANFITGASINPNTQPVVRVRLCDEQGNPHGGDGLNGLTALNPNGNDGLFNLNNGLNGSVNVQPPQPPPNNLAGVVIGSPHSGTLGPSFTPPQLTNVPNAPPNQPPGAATPPTIFRDFFTVRVVDLDKFLLGTPDPAFAVPAPGQPTLNQPPVVRTNEQLLLLDNGNDVLAAAQLSLGVANTQTQQQNNQSQSVAQTIRADFNVPQGTGNQSRWPAFPFGNQPGNPVPPNLLKQNVTFDAQVINDANGQPTPDVLLKMTIDKLPCSMALRIYPRKFVADAVEERGDGAGAVVGSGASITWLVLRDPFNLNRLDGTSDAIPPNATLRFDLMVVSPTDARLFGNNDVQVKPASVPPPQPPPPAGANNFRGNFFQSTCQSEALGFAPPGVGNAAQFAQNLLGLDSNTNPREATRFPTMAHRDLLVAGFPQAGGQFWAGVISGGRLDPESLSAEARRGAPGSPGGRETQLAGVFTQNGRLAYDLARMALRRSAYILTRMINLLNAPWNQPQPAANGTFAGAVLQNIPPICQMPSFYYLKDDMQSYPAPASLDDLINNWLTPKLQNKTMTIGGFSLSLEQPVGDVLSNTDLPAINNAVNNLGVQQASKDMIFQELQRELASAVYGRRDSEWALRAAIGRARRFIYVESPGFCSTSLDSGGKVKEGDDLISLLRAQLNTVPGLRLIVCTPRTDFPEKFQGMANYEMKDRVARLGELPPEQTALFHPIGFPGRPSRIESTVVVVDDTWALVGSSSFRRRGLRFDGSSDLVFTDTVLEKGVCPSLADFRRRVLAARLGIAPFDGNLPHPDYVRLFDGTEAFYVVKELLADGGGGKIEPLWKLPDEGASVESAKHANPDGADVAADASLFAELFSIAVLGKASV